MIPPQPWTWVLVEHVMHIVRECRPLVLGHVINQECYTVCGIKEVGMPLFTNNPPQQCEKCRGIVVRAQLLDRRK